MASPAHDDPGPEMRGYTDTIREYERKRLNRVPRLKTARYDLLSDWKRDASLPCAGERGVYAFFNEDGELLHVGKASNNSTLGRRVCSYFHAKPVDQGAKPRHPWKCKGEPRHVLITATDDAFEAPSLEEYLIQRLQPPENTVGRR